MNEKLLDILDNQTVSLLVCRDGREIFRTFGRGIRPALTLLDEHPELLRGAEVYDWIIGKAAASLFILGGAASVSAGTMSDSAAALLRAHGIPHFCRVRTRQIINRAGTGLCPFEQAVMNVERPEDCLPVIRSTLARLTGSGAAHPV